MPSRFSSKAVLIAATMAFAGFSSAAIAAGPAAMTAATNAPASASGLPVVQVQQYCDAFGCGDGAEERQRARIEGRVPNSRYYVPERFRDDDRDWRDRDRRDWRDRDRRDWRDSRGRWDRDDRWHRDRGPNIVVVPGYQPRGPQRFALSAQHVNWCRQNYRSYRVSDNSFQPFNGPRRECRSPYF